MKGTSLSNLNEVDFTGARANVVSDSSTKIVVDVPNGARSGVITVKTAGGTAKSSQKFTVQR